MSKEEIRKKIDMLLEKANEFRYVDSKRTLEISNDAFNLCKEINYTLGEKVANLYMSHAYAHIGAYEKSLSLVFNSIHCFIEEGIYDLQWMAYNILGIIFCSLGDIERSVEAHQNAKVAAIRIDLSKKYHKDFTSKRSLILTLNNISENYKILKDYKEALSYCQKAYDMDKEFDHSLSKGLTVLSLGEIYYLMGDYEKTHSLSHDALRYLKQYNYDIIIADACKLMALASWKKGAYEKADELFNIAMDLNEKESVPNYKIDALISYFEYLKDRERLNEALEVLTNACDLSIQYNLPEKLSIISIMLSSFYGDLRDYENAFKYTKLHYEYEAVYTQSYYNNIINSLNIKKKIQEIEKENNKIIEKNRNLKIQKQSLQMIVEKISIISELGQEITSTLNKDSIIDILYSSIKSIMDLSFFAIGLYDENSSMVNYLDVIFNDRKMKKASISINDGQTFVAKCIKSRELIIINDTSKEFTKFIDEKTYNDQLKLSNNAELNSLIFCPLIVNTKIIGVMTIQSEEKNAFTPYHIEMVKSLSSYAAIAINNVIKSTELENLNGVLLSLSEEDKLTGIANRRKFDDYINQIWNDSIRDRNSIALLVIDIDYFKQYNDGFGHLEGDKCITSVANILEHLNTRPYFVARYGGDEFMIVLPKCSIDDAVKFGEDIKIKIAELKIPHKFSKILDTITLSIGVTAIIPNKNIAINEFIRKADDALYISKKRGRNKVSAIEY